MVGTGGWEGGLRVEPPPQIITLNCLDDSVLKSHLLDLGSIENISAVKQSSTQLHSATVAPNSARVCSQPSEMTCFTQSQACLGPVMNVLVIKHTAPANSKVSAFSRESMPIDWRVKEQFKSGCVALGKSISIFFSKNDRWDLLILYSALEF